MNHSVYMLITIWFFAYLYIMFTLFVCCCFLLLRWCNILQAFAFSCISSILCVFKSVLVVLMKNELNWIELNWIELSWKCHKPGQIKLKLWAGSALKHCTPSCFWYTACCQWMLCWCCKFKIDHSKNLYIYIYFFLILGIKMTLLRDFLFTDDTPSHWRLPPPPGFGSMASGKDHESLICHLYCLLSQRQEGADKPQ